MLGKKTEKKRELITIGAMLRIYCRYHHKPEDYLCQDCDSLLNYAGERLDRCPFGTDKPTCQNCTIHCYKPARRQQARQVMQFAGSRMIWRHPFLAIIHLINNRKESRISQ